MRPFGGGLPDPLAEAHDQMLAGAADVHVVARGGDEPTPDEVEVEVLARGETVSADGA